MRIFTVTYTGFDGGGSVAEQLVACSTAHAERLARNAAVRKWGAAGAATLTIHVGGIYAYDAVR